MKKRVVSWLLVVLMLTSVLPTSVLAEMVDAAASTAVEQPLTEDTAVPKEPEEQEGSKTPEAPETPEVPEDTENTDDAEQEAGPQSAVQSADIMVQAAAVTEISTAAEFAGMSATGSYKLTKDITVTAPYKKADFTGTFDGDNHTITFTYDSTGNVNAGLFLRTGKNAVIKNLKVEVALTSTAASASCGTGGLVGTVYGATTITNCHISGNVQNTNKGSSYSAAYVGGLVGYWPSRRVSVHLAPAFGCRHSPAAPPHMRQRKQVHVVSPASPPAIAPHCAPQSCGAADAIAGTYLLAGGAYPFRRPVQCRSCDRCKIPKFAFPHA